MSSISFNPSIRSVAFAPSHESGNLSAANLRPSFSHPGDGLEIVAVNWDGMRESENVIDCRGLNPDQCREKVKEHDRMSEAREKAKQQQPQQKPDAGAPDAPQKP